MDDQNNPGGNQPSEPTTPGMSPTPPATEPTSEPAPQQNCVTCGQAASGGNCVACGQGEMSCTCQPAAPTGGQGEPSAPAGEPSPGAPVV